MDTCAAPNPEKSTLQGAIMPKLPELPIAVTKEKPGKDNDNDAFKTASDAEENEEEDLEEEEEEELGDDEELDNVPPSTSAAQDVDGEGSPTSEMDKDTKKQDKPLSVGKSEGVKVEASKSPVIPSPQKPGGAKVQIAEPSSPEEKNKLLKDAPDPAKAKATGAKRNQTFLPASLPSKVARKGRGSSILTKSYRKVQYPWLWLYNKLVGYGSIDDVKIMSKYLPTFFIIPRESEPYVLPHTKMHVVTMKSGRKLVALKDMQSCKDSRRWYKKQKKEVHKDLVEMRYTRGTIEELDELSEKQFGRYLKHQWDSGIKKAADAIRHQQKIRGQEKDH